MTRRPTFRPPPPITTNLPPRPTTIRPNFRLPPATTTPEPPQRFATTTNRQIILDSFVPTRRPISLESSPLLGNQNPQNPSSFDNVELGTLPPLLEDEEGPFEYVYYYEYEYEDDLPPEEVPAPPKTTPVQQQNIPRPTFNFQTKIPSLSDTNPSLESSSPPRPAPPPASNRIPPPAVPRQPPPSNPSLPRRPPVSEPPVQRRPPPPPPPPTAKPEVRRTTAPPKPPRIQEPVQRKPTPPSRPSRPSPPKPAPSPKRPKNPPSKLPVFSFFPQIEQGGPENVREFPRSQNTETRPKQNNPPEQKNKSRKPVSSPSKQRGGSSQESTNTRNRPKNVPKENINESDFRKSNQRNNPRPQTTESAPPPPTRPPPTRPPPTRPPPTRPPPTRPPPTQRGRVQQQSERGNTPFTAFNNFPQFPRTPEPQREPTNIPIPSQSSARPPLSNDPSFQSRFPPIEPVRPIQSQRPRPTFGVFESVQLQTGGQLQTPIDPNIPQQPLPPPPSAPRQPPAIPPQIRPQPRPQLQGLVNNVIQHDSGSQSSSFFSFNRPIPQQQQQFSNEQFTNRFQQPPPPRQTAVQNVQQLLNSPQFTTQQQFSSFIQDFEQPLFDPRGVPQTPRFSARPNPVPNPQFSRGPPSQLPPQQQRGSFDPERPLRTQRALPPQLSGEDLSNSDKKQNVSSSKSSSKQNTVSKKSKKHRKTERVSFPKKEEFNFPDAEFGGFVPVRSRNRRKSNWSNFFSF